MKLYEIVYPDEQGNAVFEILTEEEILEYYYPYWVERMTEVGRAHMIDKQTCIDDWCTIHWASIIDVPV